MRRRLVCALCIALGAAASAREQPDHAASAADLRGQLAAARAEPGNADATDDLLRRLIETSPEDPEAPTWMLDRAELALQRAARDGAASSLMFGIPGREQPIWVSMHAAAAAELCAQARAAIDAAVARLEGELLEPGTDAEQARVTAARVEPLLAMLIETEQAVRLPEIEFAAVALRALGEPQHEPRERALRESLARLAGGGTMRDALASPRAALLGAALLLRSDDGAARDAASRLLERLLGPLGAGKPGEPQRTIAPSDAVRLCMALIACGRESDAERMPCPGRGEDWLVDLLLAEARARVQMRSVQRGGENATDGIVRAAGHLMRIAERYDGGAAALDTAAGPSALRQLVYEKVATLVPPGSAWALIDPEIALARAWMLRSVNLPRDVRPERAASAECLALLEAVAARSDAHDAVRAQARWLLAAEHVRSSGHRETAACDALVRIVVELPRTRLARAAAEKIVREHAPDLSGEVVVFESHRQAAAVASALRLLAADDPPQDATLAGLAVALVGHGGVCGDTWSEAVAACQRIAAADQHERIARLLTSRIDAMLHATQPVQERVDALAAAAKWLEARGQAWRSLELRLQRAELIIERGTSHDARAEIDALVGSAMDRAGTIERARLRTLRGIALRRAGDDAAAMAEFRAVAAECERDARSTGDRAAAREAFWSAWAEMLEIAAASSGDAPERAEQARRHRQRLELLDPSLGGEPWAGRIRAATGSQGK
ncbi:MAG: hypothetical protein KF699_06215 [Phycisphaeraceae bacterium]|nr:hypothetical protein [Phycisphaeraceae bacterium]